MSRERQTTSLATMMGKGIGCPHCGSVADSVIDSTPQRGYIVRKRWCRRCKTLTTTHEYPALSAKAED